MNMRPPRKTRISGIDVPEDRCVSVKADPIREIPLWGLRKQTHEIEFQLLPPITFELHYQLPVYLMVHTFNGTQGQFSVGDAPLQPWVMEARCTCVIRPELPIRIVQPTPLEYLAIGVQPSLFEGVMGTSAPTWRGSDSLYKTMDYALQAIFAEIRRAMIADPHSIEAYLKSLVIAALTRISQNHLDLPASPTLRETLAPSVARKISETIESTLDGPISVQNLANQANLSRAHFSRAFTNTFGGAPQQYILSRREHSLNHASCRCLWILKPIAPVDGVQKTVGVNPKELP